LFGGTPRKYKAGGNAAVLVLSICKAPARDLGQWDGVDPLHRQWFNGLMQPDRPNLSCCGEADGYWADSYEVKGDQYVAIITDTRDDTKLGRRQHIEAGTRVAVPNSKIKWGIIRPGTALSSSALVVTFFVTCHPGEDSHSASANNR
jgi:hypothetical protein